MPGSANLQDEAILNIFYTNAAHLKCSDGSYYLVCTDVLMPYKGITAEVVPPGSTEHKKALALQEKGEYNPYDDDKPTLRSVK